MKKRILFTMLILSLCVVGQSQTNPQFEFYNQTDYTSLLSSIEGNDYMTYFAIQLVLFFEENNNKDKVQLVHRLYEIEHTSIIQYTTDDGESLNFKTDSDTLSKNTEVDFGTTLEANTSDFWGAKKLWFASPVTKIDPAIFAQNVSYIKFPSSSGLKYESSPSMCVTNLSHLDGLDVINNRLLVDKDGTLIAAAVAGLKDFTIPNQISRIGEGAFRGCTLKSITIPENVESIGDGAFEICSEMESITILSPNLIHIGNSSFETGKEYKYKIYVPKQCYKAYRQQHPSLKRRFKKIK